MFPRLSPQYFGGTMYTPYTKRFDDYVPTVGKQGKQGSKKDINTALSATQFNCHCKDCVCEPIPGSIKTDKKGNKVMLRTSDVPKGKIVCEMFQKAKDPYDYCAFGRKE